MLVLRRVALQISVYCEYYHPSPAVGRLLLRGSGTMDHRMMSGVCVSIYIYIIRIDLV